MHTLLLLAIFSGGVSMAPIREFQPYPHVKCPRGYSLWWPAGREFDNDRYAQCVKESATKSGKALKNASLRAKKNQR